MILEPVPAIQPACNADSIITHIKRTIKFFPVIKLNDFSRTMLYNNANEPPLVVVVGSGKPGGLLVGIKIEKISKSTKLKNNFEEYNKKIRV